MKFIDELYTFNEDSRAAKFFQWIYGVKPAETFPGMCPYFWSYLLTIIFIVPILFIRLLIPHGQKLLEYTRTLDRAIYRKRRLEVYKIWRASSTDEEAYSLWNSKLFKKIYNYEDRISCLAWQSMSHNSHTYKEILDKKITKYHYNRVPTYMYMLRDLQERTHRHRILLSASNREDQLRREQSARERKDNISSIVQKYYIGKILALALLILLSLGLIAAIKGLIYLAPSGFNFGAWFMEILPKLGLFMLGAFIGYISFLLIRYIIPYIGEFLSALPDSRFGKGFSKFFSYIWNNILGSVGRGFISFLAIVADTIYAAYKGACPRITWVKNSENK